MTQLLDEVFPSWRIASVAVILIAICSVIIADELERRRWK